MTWIERHWYRDTLLSRLLAPLGWLYCIVVRARRFTYEHGLRRRIRVGVPVIVVGNVTVGGTGKTPLVAWIARHLGAHGYRPGIVTRGYGGVARDWPRTVSADADPREVGDEPVVLARRAGCPVVADPKRVRGAVSLMRDHGCDVVVSDDGLQHLRLARDIDIVVVDGERRFGNGRCLPAGPLREPARRVHAADLILTRRETEAGDWGVALAARDILPVVGIGEPSSMERLGRHVHAVAGIGVPRRFFAQLERLGFAPIPHAFPDHHMFRRSDIEFGDDLPIIMTEKDAVKCSRLIAAGEPYWYLAVDAVPDARLGPWLAKRLAEITRG